MRYQDFRKKEVINIQTGKSLGYIQDIEFEEKTGCICAIIVPGDGKWNFFCFKEAGCRIEYGNIVRIGPDFVLVNSCEPCKSKRPELW